MKRVFSSLLLGLGLWGWAGVVSAQILFSAGTYSQNFDTLANSGTTNEWIDNVTLPGWYASKTASGTNVTVYQIKDGSGNTGGLYSFGSTSSSERALGSICSGGVGSIAYGVRFLNDTPSTAQSNIVVSYTGEQWRNGGNANAHKLAFFYRVGTAITNADASNSPLWSAFTNLDFITPTTGASASALDGNNPTNQMVFTAVELPGITVLPGQELFLRWYDIDDTGNDHGFAIDNLTVTFAGTDDVRPPSILTPPQDQIVAQGSNVTFTVSANGAAPLSYQWQLEGVSLSTATKSFLSLTNVDSSNVGTYTVIVSNAYGFTNASALLTVTGSTATPSSFGFSLMTYNVKGNGATNWATNSLQVQAIGREVMYLQPDVITFNEIPYDYTYEMTNFIKAFLPGYFLATNSGTDNYIRSAIASRYPISRSTKWLDGADLDPFGYTNANFTRDLFEAQINVPNFSRPLHVFVTHLKSSASGYADAAAKRAAEAAAITNFFATNFFVLYPNDPYTLSGDMNESDTTTLALQELFSAPTGLHLTNPKNPATGSSNTYSIQATVNERIDYIMPCDLLFSNIVSSQVFRSDRVTPLPSDLLSTDSKTASDHIPVLMYFNNPYDVPYRISSINLAGQLVTLNWPAMAGVQYRIDFSTDLTAWTPIRTNTALSSTGSFTTNAASIPQFFRIRRLP